MTDVQTATADDGGGNLIYPVAVVKAGGAVIQVNIDALSVEMMQWVISEGLKAIVNKIGSKFTSKEYPDPAQLKTAALAAAKARADELQSGTLKKGRTSTRVKGESGAVMTEARRLAKAAIKAQLKADGWKVSSVPASEVTALANDLLASDPSFVEQARQNVDAVGEKTKGIKVNLGQRFKLGDADKAKRPPKGVRPPQFPTTGAQAAKVKPGVKPQPTARH